MAKSTGGQRSELGPVKYGVSLRHERLVGRAIISWSRLEAAIQDIIWVILDVPLEDGRIITARMDAIKKMQWIKSFSKRHLDGKPLEDMEFILSKVDDLLDDRNFIVHTSWGTLVNTGEPVGMSLRRKSQPHEIVTEAFPERRMLEFISDVDAARNGLIAWRKQHESLPGRRTPPLYWDVYIPPEDPEQ
jgi:hypothetical protein